MRQFLIDTDTASDDAVALLMALSRRDIEVAAITTVSGNVDVDQATRNALYTVELSGVPCPVFKGAAKPLLREPVHAHFFHGVDGLGDQGYPPPSKAAADGHAVPALIEVIRDNRDLTVVTLGPLTNLALALLQAPDIVGRVARCVVMGGAPCTVGNVTPAAEYNMWVDPDAARIVFHSGLPIELVGWQLCRGEANIDPSEMEFIRSLGNPRADFAIDCNRTAIEANRRQSGDRGLSLPDPVAMAVALEPSISLRSERHYVDIETSSELTRGMTVVDAFNVAGDERNRSVWSRLVQRPANALVHWEIDIPQWKSTLFRCLG